MDGEFICEEFAYQTKAIGGGNFLILGKSIDALLKVAEGAVSEMSNQKYNFTFSWGNCKVGSKVVQNIKI